MKKIWSLLMLISICNPVNLLSQTDNSNWRQWSKTDWTFNMFPTFIHIRDFVYLQNENKITFELDYPEQYDSLKNLDSVIIRFLKDIAFYKDSMETGSGNYTINYTLDQKYDFSQIRFKKYPADGNIFMDKNGDISKLKLDQDTIRFYFRGYPVYNRLKNRLERKYSLYHWEEMQVTFYVNKYSDLAEIALNKPMLSHIIDTLHLALKKKTLQNSMKYPSSSVYRPIVKNVNSRFTQYPRIVSTDKMGADYFKRDVTYKKFKFDLTANLGCSLVRNTLAPGGEIGILYRDSKYLGDGHAYDVFRLYMSSYFFFDPITNGNYSIKDNWFVNVDVGSPNDNDRISNTVVMLSIGAGYLVIPNGNYFNGTTMKLFMNVQFNKHGLTVSPEIISTNNLKQFFPALTLKVF